MKRFGIALLLAAAPSLMTGAGRFDQKLTVDKQIMHALNRLTFGARPADVAEVRRIGVDKWIDQQMHPEKIAENPILDAKLKPLETLQMATWQIMEKYQQPVIRNPFPQIPVQIMTMLLNGSIDERKNTLAGLNPEMRKNVLAAAPLQAFEGLPDAIRQESEAARKAIQEETQKQFRVMNPPLNELITPDQMRIGRSGTTEQKLALVNSFEGDKRRQVIRGFGPQAFAEIPELRREAMAGQNPPLFVNTELIENKLYRAIYSNRQLEEVLVHWFNHFNVFNGKAQDRFLLTSYEREAIRPHVLGHFKDMLLATARHPAMLMYLDNFQSQVPRDDFPQPPNGPNGQPLRRPGLNENYGREVMELHTLGVDGGYTQQDVVAVARAFSGWTIYDVGKYAEYQFQPAMHDRKEKVVLGHALPPGRGEQDGLDVIDILARHPSTAKFISKKLAQRFVADEPPQQLVDRMAATFTKTDGDLRAVLQTMFSSVEFMSEGAWQAKMKSPLEMVVGAVRALNADVVDPFTLAQRIADLGEPLYGKSEPTGYSNTGEAWTNTASILGRINFSTALASGQVPGVKVDLSRFNFKEPSVVASEILAITPSQPTITAIQNGIQGKEATPSLLVTLVMSSPDFQKR